MHAGSVTRRQGINIEGLFASCGSNDARPPSACIAVDGPSVKLAHVLLEPAMCGPLANLR